MLKEKFEIFLENMEAFLAEYGYQKCRKKGKYQKHVSGKIISLSIVRDRVLGGGRLWELRIFAAAEYPAMEEIVSALQGEPYRKGEDFFVQDVGLFSGEHGYHPFYFYEESDAGNFAASVGSYLTQRVFPLLQAYEEDEKIIRIFQKDDISWRSIYFSGGHVDIHFYLRRISLCVLNGYIEEAFAILKNIPRWVGAGESAAERTERLKALCAGKRQADSFYLLIAGMEELAGDVKVNPDEEEILQGLFALDGLAHYYMILENPLQGNYFQAAGGSGEFIAEIRIYDEADHRKYRHYRAERRTDNQTEPISGEQRTRQLLYGNQYLHIPECQVLSVEETYRIARRFLAEQKLHEKYQWIALDL